MAMAQVSNYFIIFFGVFLQNALPPAKQTELEALNAPALGYYNV